MDEKARRKRSYAAGYLLNLAGKPLPLNTKREPVAYLYNGVRLPKLPEWDRGKYPYAFIEKWDFSWIGEENIWELCVFSDNVEWILDRTEPSVLGTVVSYFMTDSVETAENNKEVLDIGVNAWGSAVEQEDDDGNGFTIKNPIWTNHDILKEDGTVYFAASEPIPVYE